MSGPVSPFVPSSQPQAGVPRGRSAGETELHRIQGPLALE